MASPMSPSNGAPRPASPSSALVDQFRTDDPAWMPPVDPLANGDVRARASIIHREIPISAVVTGWDVPSARAAKRDLVLGLFEQSSQMVDAMIMSDSRVQSGLASRLSILGRPVDFMLPRKYRDSSLAQECLDAFADAWPEMATEAVLGELHRWGIMQGFGPAQLLWEFGEYAIPHPLSWHSRYVYYHWLLRCYVAITLDGQEPIIPGDGSWVLHAPFGAYRGWMRGALGAITPWWLGRAYALRDWMRYSERHGLPIVKIKRPAVGDPYQYAQLRIQVANMGQEAVFDLPQNPPPALSNDIDLLEAKDTAHEGFRMLIEQCNQEITLALLAQTLTTSMPAEGGSSYAAARVHAGVLQGLMEADARALAFTVYQQIARPFAAINFGNPDLAPRVVWDVTPYEDALTRAKTLQTVAASLFALRQGGIKLGARGTRKLFKMFALDVNDLEEVEPLQIEAQAARASGEVKDGEGSDGRAPSPMGVRSRIANLMARIDPRVVERANLSRARFVEAEDDGMREAMAEIEAEIEGRRSGRRVWIP